jgi:hypothetical protein
MILDAYIPQRIDVKTPYAYASRFFISVDGSSLFDHGCYQTNMAHQIIGE